jgi:peptide chain release factor 1
MLRSALLLFLVCYCNGFCYTFIKWKLALGRGRPLKMVLDPYVLEKLHNIRRNFEALTERLADPDIANDRPLMLTLSRERSASEHTVVAYLKWLKLSGEQNGLVEMTSCSDPELRSMARDESQQLSVRIDGVEKEILQLLLPKDLNDERNVMLEVRSGECTLSVL